MQPVHPYLFTKWPDAEVTQWIAQVKDVMLEYPAGRELVAQEQLFTQKLLNRIEGLAELRGNLLRNARLFVQHWLSSLPGPRRTFLDNTQAPLPLPFAPTPPQPEDLDRFLADTPPPYAPPPYAPPPDTNL